MKLSDLVRYLNRLDDQVRPNADLLCQQHLDEHIRIVTHTQPYLQQHAERLSSIREHVREHLQVFDAAVDDTRTEIQAMIDALQPAYFAESYRLHDEEMTQDPDELIMTRHPVLSDPVRQYLSARIQLKSDWHHAGLVIRPSLGEWLPQLVGCDPLYLADVRQSLLDPCMQQFTPDYQRRLRRYVLRENDSQGLVLGDLPDGQFGFCLALDFFHYKPLELIRLYLTDIYRKLKPGGVVAFTFNDCDRAGGVELVERHFMCYTPGSMIVALCESLGFEIQQRYQIDASNTWLELQRPGELTSLRGGQSLAKIVAGR